MCTDEGGIHLDRLVEVGQSEIVAFLSEIRAASLHVRLRQLRIQANGGLYRGDCLVKLPLQNQRPATGQKPKGEVRVRLRQSPGVGHRCRDIGVLNVNRGTVDQQQWISRLKLETGRIVLERGGIKLAQGLYEPPRLKIFCLLAVRNSKYAVNVGLGSTLIAARHL